LINFYKKNKQRRQEAKSHLQNVISKIKAKGDNEELLKQLNDRLSEVDFSLGPSQDNGIVFLFSQSISVELQRYIDLKKFEEFKVDPSLIAKYKKLDELAATETTERQEYREAANLKMTKILDQVREYNKQAVTNLEALGKEAGELSDLWWNGTVSDVYAKYPVWEKKCEWLIARHRWDPEDSDDYYREHAPLDKSHWNLPRDP